MILMIAAPIASLIAPGTERSHCTAALLALRSHQGAQSDRMTIRLNSTLVVRKWVGIRVNYQQTLAVLGIKAKVNEYEASFSPTAKLCIHIQAKGFGVGGTR